MKLSRFDYHALRYIAAFTFDNPRGQHWKQKSAYRKGRVRAASSRAQRSRRANRRS